MHLPDGDGVEVGEAFALGQGHVNEFGGHGFDVGEDEQLLDAGVFAHVAFELGVGIAPLFGGLAEQRHVEQIGLGGVGDGGLGQSHNGGNEVGLKNNKKEAKEEQRQRADEVPG